MKPFWQRPPKKSKKKKAEIQGRTESFADNFQIKANALGSTASYNSQSTIY